jgi:serine/threonine protein phosphatase PrpC
VLGSATLSAKKLNEDAHQIFRGLRINSAAVADGVGSAVDSHLASRAAVHAFSEAVAKLDEKNRPVTMADVRVCWAEAGRAIRLLYEAAAAEYGNDRRVLQTTLLTVVETSDSFIVSYLGNGSLHLVRGDFFTFLPRRFPWCLTDLATGHTRLGDNGQEVLFAVLHPLADVSAVRMMCIEKDRQLGEIIILATDGICSPDHLAIGSDDQGRKWVEMNAHLERFVCRHLPSMMLTDGAGRLTKVPADEQLKTFLNEAAYDDDATIAVVISEAAFEHRHRYGEGEVPCKSK